MNGSGSPVYNGKTHKTPLLMLKKNFIQGIKSVSNGRVGEWNAVAANKSGASTS